MLNCKQASELISQSLDEPISFSDKLQLKFHLLICKYCKRFSRQMHTIRAAMSELRSKIEADTSIKLSEDAKKRILDEINKEH